MQHGVGILRIFGVRFELGFEIISELFLMYVG